MINKDVKVILISSSALTIALSIICLFIKPICSIITLMLGALLTCVFAWYTIKRYKKLSDLNNYLSAVCSGNFDLRISENTEGELSILSNNLYKVITILKSQNEMLVKDKTYLADSLANISHQLKTPLTSMMVMTDLLKNDNQPEKRDEFLSITEEQLDKMKWLITNLLKLSKLDAGTVEFKNEPFSIKSAIEQCLKPFLVTFDLRGIKFLNNVEEFFVSGDEGWTVEAIGNIIKNCIEHTDKNAKISISSSSTSIYNSIIIKDNGCGIEKEDLPHIFERFYHAKNSHSESIGIGLALSKAVFEREHATVNVKSEIGVGSEFEIRFYNAIV